MRRSRFKLESGGRVFDGRRRATVTISVEDGGRSMFGVRPYRARKASEIVVPLDEVARLVLDRAAKARADEIVRARKIKRAVLRTGVQR